MLLFRKPGNEWAGGALVFAIVVSATGQSLGFGRRNSGDVEEKIEEQLMTNENQNKALDPKNLEKEKALSSAISQLEKRYGSGAIMKHRTATR